MLLNKLVFCTCILIFFGKAFAQNLISNPSFEENGEPYCDGWFPGGTIPFSNCDSTGTLLASIVKSSPDDSISGLWSLELFGSLPDSGNVWTFIPAIPGTHVYELNFWMNSSNFGGMAGINIKNAPPENTKWLEDWGQPWQFYSLVDTITASASDSISIVLATRTGDFCLCKVQFDQIELRKIDTITSTAEVVIPSFSSIHPNPLTDQSVLRLQNPFHRTVTIIFFNVLGQIVQQVQTAENEYLINRSDFNEGIFYYQIIAKGKTWGLGKFLVY